MITVILAWIFFLIGQAIHLALQINAMVNAPNSAAKSWSMVFRAKGATFAARAFVCTMVFWLWLDGQLLMVLQDTGLQVPGWISSLIGLHISGGVAGIAGFAIDSAIAYIPGLKSTLPPAE